MSRNDVAEARENTQTALFEEIQSQVAVLASMDKLPLNARTEMLRELALAYRLTSGGAQPGSSLLER